MRGRIFLLIAIQIIASIIANAHPGSGIVVDQKGQVYFTDTGKGVWKIDTKGKLSFLPASRFHWMTIDLKGAFSRTGKMFGDYFERVTPLGIQPTLVMCSDFPLVFGQDGNIFYVNTRTGSANIIKRTPDGRETILVRDKIFSAVGGIASGTGGDLYITEGGNQLATTIRKVGLDGKISIIATFVGNSTTNPPLETFPSYCRGLTVDSAGTIYVAATGSRSVLKISPKGKIETVLKTTGPWTPTGVAEFKGEVYVLEWHDVSAENLEVRTAYVPRVRKIDRFGKVSTLVTISR